MTEPKESPLRLVAQLRSPHVVADDVVREELAALMPETELAKAWAALLELERRTGLEGLAAIDATKLMPVVAPAEPGEPRFPVSPEDLELAALIASPATIPDDVIRPQLCDVLARSPLGPAMWKVRDIEWAVSVPPVFPEPLPGIAALDRWRVAGELVDELLGLPVEERAAVAKSEGYRSSLVVHQLLDRCQDERFEEVERYLELSKLAVDISNSVISCAGENWRRYRGLYALALVISANGYRMIGDLAAASKLVAKGDAWIIGEPDALVQGLYSGHKAALLTYMRQLDEARKASTHALACYRRAGDRHWVAKEVMQTNAIDFSAGQLSRDGLHRLKAAMALVDPFREPFLGNALLLNLARYQAELRLTDEALQTWKQVRPFQQRINELRRIVVLGLIYEAAERWDDAVEQLAVATKGLKCIGHCDGNYIQLLLARTLQGAGCHLEAIHEASQAARFFATVHVESIASVARLILTEAAKGAVATASIAALIKAVEIGSIVVEPHRS